MRALILLFGLNLFFFQIAVSQVYKLPTDANAFKVPGKNGIQYLSVRKLSAPHISTFKGVRDIIPGQTEIIKEEQTVKSKLPYEQQVIGSPVVNSGIQNTEISTKILLNYVSENYDTTNSQLGVVKKIKITLPTIVEAGNALYKEDATINMKYFDIAQGLFSSYIMALARDTIGTIWMGTYGAGLVAYDGRSFYQYSIEQGLPTNKILSLFIDSRNRIWIGTFNNGLICFDGNEFLHFNIKTGLPGNKVRAIKEDKQGRLWIGTDNGLSAIQDNALYVYGKNQGLDIKQIYDLAIGPNNELWIGTFNMGLIKFDGISFFQYSILQGLATSAIWAVNTDQDGNVWMGTFGEGIIKFDGNTFSQYSSDQGIETTEIFRVIRDNDKNLWFGTDGGGIIKYDGKAFNIINSSHGLTNDIIWDIIDDPAGNYWIASYGGGLMKYDGGSLQYYTDKQGFSDNIALSFIEDKSKNIWIGGWGNGLMKYDGTHLSSWDNTCGLPENTIWDLEIDNQDNLWLATEGVGVSKIKSGLVTTYNSESGLLHDEVTSLMADDKGLWVGTYGGLNYITQDTVYQYNNEDGLLLSEIKDIKKDRFGSIWISSNDKGLVAFAHNKFMLINKKHGLSSNTVYGVYQDKFGNLWVATNNKVNIIPVGIVENIYKILARDDYKALSVELYNQLNKGIKIIGKENGLLGDLIRNFISLNNEDIWIGTENGISKLALYKDDNFNVPTINIYGNDYTIENYGYQQGFIGGDIFANHSVGKDCDGNIWWGTGKLITRMNVDNKKSDTLLPVVQLTAVDLFYESINWMGKQSNSPEKQLSNKISFGKTPVINYSGTTPWNFLPKNLELSHGVNHITFNFTGLDWKNSKELTYQFMLAGYEEYWNPLTSLHKSTYSNLEPGSYIFRVKAINEAGLSSKEVAFKFSILPPWWKTIWFKITAILSAVIIVYIVYQWRIASYKHRQKELEVIVKERTSEITEKNEELMQQTEEIIAQRNEIESKKNQLERVHQDLMESIEYSHFIQSSMMPSSKTAQGLSDQFIFFKPKERISGDFYWWTTIDNKLIATVADCTGHGVPGALMSMLGISFLREIVIKEGIHEPAVILNKLRQEIIAVLDQRMERGAQKDGMDMAMICVDLNDHSALFAGARNTMIHVRDGKLTEYKSDKAPISIYLKMKEFTQQVIQLKPGDQIYLFSDGFTDQFNGNTGKKIKRSRLKQILLSISQKSMMEQKENLIDYFDKWKGEEEQIDDVTIVGFKL